MVAQPTMKQRTLRIALGEALRNPIGPRAIYVTVLGRGGVLISEMKLCHGGVSRLGIQATLPKSQCNASAFTPSEGIGPLAYASKEEEELIEPWMQAHVDPFLESKGRKGYVGKSGREVTRQGRQILAKSGGKILFRVLFVFDDNGIPLMFLRMDEYGLPRAPQSYRIDALEPLVGRWVRAHLGRSKLDDP